MTFKLVSSKRSLVSIEANHKIYSNKMTYGQATTTTTLNARQAFGNNMATLHPDTVQLNKRETRVKPSHSIDSKAPFTRERNRSVPYRSVPKSGTLRGCVHTGTLEITSFRSKKWNDEKNDTKSGTIRNRSVPFPCEQAMRSKLVQKTER